MHLFEIVLQYYIGIFFLYFGLNGIFNFQKIPEPSHEMKLFLDHIAHTRFILPTAKLIEVLAGLLMILGTGKLFALIFLLPIVFGITTSQILFNFQKGMGITLLTAIPYFTYLFIHYEKIADLASRWP